MTADQRFALRIDVRNPGQFFACCGLLELAHRLWPGAEGCFRQDVEFAITINGTDVAVNALLASLAKVTMSGLTKEERGEREALEAERNRLQKADKSLPAERERRRVELGQQARAGALRLEATDCSPAFFLSLDWWREETTPKTWAGRQEVHKVARAAQDAIADIAESDAPFDYSCVLRTPADYAKKPADINKSVEPFYFDARRFAHALDTGFSLDNIGAETVAHPAVELLALIGIQRFRPRQASKGSHFEYWTWREPLCAAIAACAAGGAIQTPGGRQYRFPLRFRDDQRRYKAFGRAIAVGDSE
jgi:CRISPR-associated protein Csb3